MKKFSYQSIKTIEVAETDFPDKMPWEEAKVACENLGEGWRLPTREEMEELFEEFHKKGEGNFEAGADYWLAEHNPSAIFEDTFGYYAGYEYETKFLDHNVRAVKSVKEIVKVS